MSRETVRGIGCMSRETGCMSRDCGCTCRETVAVHVGRLVACAGSLAV